MGRVGRLTAMQALCTRRRHLSGIRRTWSLLVATALLTLAAGARSELNDSTPVFIIRTEAEAKQAIALYATGDREVMFTTVSFTHKGIALSSTSLLSLKSKCQLHALDHSQGLARVRPVQQPLLVQYKS